MDQKIHTQSSNTLVYFQTNKAFLHIDKKFIGAPLDDFLKALWKKTVVMGDTNSQVLFLRQVKYLKTRQYQQFCKHLKDSHWTRK